MGEPAVGNSVEYIAFYGSLMRGQGTQEQLSVAGKLAYVSPCWISGTLYELGDYPGLCAEPVAARVAAELFRIVDGSVLAVLDEYEDFRPNEPEQSLFERRLVKLAEPEFEAWVYIYRRVPPADARIADGIWRGHRAR